MVDNLTVVDDAKTRSGDEKFDVIPRRLFQSRRKPSLNTDDDSSHFSPTAKRAGVKIVTSHNPTDGRSKGIHHTCRVFEV